ncbi:MAG: hypothetical protein WBQ10_16530 [Terriglobales bacterium]
MIKRLYFIVLVFLLAAPLLPAQESQSDNSQPSNIGGAWQLSWRGRDGSQQATIQIQQDGSKLSGTFQGPRGSSQMTGSVSGNNVSFRVQMQGHRTITLAFTGTIDGDKMSGSFQPQGGGGGHEGRGSGQGDHSWSAVRQQGNSGGNEPANYDEDDEYGL